MPSLDSYDHRTGTHCGAATLRNVSDFYGWGYDEAECFGLGAGLVFDLLDHPDREHPVPRASADWLVEAFFENLEIPHFLGEGDTWESAWDDVADTIDSDDPAILHLDAEALPYLPDEDVHSFPHPVALVGYEVEGEDGDIAEVLLSDPSMDERQRIGPDALRDAWTIDGAVSREFAYVTVTRARQLQDTDTAAARSINQTVDYFQHALDAPRTTGGPGDEGIPALRTFAAGMPDWSDLDDPGAQARATIRALDWHGEDTALRGFYAESLAQLAPRAGLGGGWRNRLDGVADGWQSVLDQLRDVAENGEDGGDGANRGGDVAATLEEAGSVLQATVEREEQFFDRLDQEI